MFSKLNKWRKSGSSENNNGKGIVPNIQNTLPKYIPPQGEEQKKLAKLANPERKSLSYLLGDLNELTRKEAFDLLEKVDQKKLFLNKDEEEFLSAIANPESISSLSIDLNALTKKEATDLLKIIAKERLLANPDEIELLMTIVDPNRKKANYRSHISNVSKSNFSDRLSEFDQELYNKPSYVVPSHSEHFDMIIKRQADVKATTGVILTESQAWSLVLADLESSQRKDSLREKSLKRLITLNEKFKTKYTEKDIDKILDHLKKNTLLATNYTFSKQPGANTGSTSIRETLIDVLLKDTEFRSVWQTGASQASTDFNRRGAVEESMGYGLPLKRVGGQPLNQLAVGSGFDPATDSKFEMPKYAALVSQYQTSGVAPRYGHSIVYWKNTLKNRITHTPGDSWNTNANMGALSSFTSSNNAESLLAFSDESLIRLAAAEATGQDQVFLKEVMNNGGLSTDSYIETQIHGSLSWNDIDKIVIGEEEGLDDTIADVVEREKHRKEYIEQLKTSLQKFKAAKGYTFQVIMKAEAKENLKKGGSTPHAPQPVSTGKNQSNKPSHRHRQPGVSDKWESYKSLNSTRDYNFTAIHEDIIALIMQGMNLDQIHRQLHDVDGLPHNVIDDIFARYHLK